VVATDYAPTAAAPSPPACRSCRSPTAGEVRVYPLVDTTGRPYPRLEEVRAALAGQGVDSQVRAARGAWVAGGDRSLACPPGALTGPSWRPLRSRRVARSVG
jgi:hypothetical protein